MEVPSLKQIALFGLGIGLLLAGVLTRGGAWIAGVTAQNSTPEALTGATKMVFVERSEYMTNILRGESAVAAGDLRAWRPNPLYDEANKSDTGIRSQGSFGAMNAACDCLVDETIVFADGSALEVQGIQLGRGVPSSRTFVEGSEQYLSATGTVSVPPTDDLALWTMTIVVAVPGG